MANNDIIGDIAGKVIRGGINSVVSAADDTINSILNLDNSKNKNDNTETDDENDDDDTEKYEQNAVIARKEYIDKYGIRQQVVICNISVNFFKFLFLIFFCIECSDNPCSCKLFPCNSVKIIC